MGYELHQALDALKSLDSKQSEDELNDFFEILLKQDRELALEAINDERCSFSAFFMLIPKIELKNLQRGLNERNLYALNLYRNKVNRSGTKAAEESASAINALKWIVSTGIAGDGMSDIYDELMDAAVIRLIMTYRDTSVLPDAVRLIFLRNKRGSFSHDIVWAVFRSHSIDSLKLIAEYLLSPDRRDAEFSARLLYLKPPSDLMLAANKKLYESYLSWLEENGEFLYFTGDNFQRTSEPAFFKLNASAKYIGKPVSKRTGMPLGNLSDNELRTMNLFENAGEREKEALLAHSDRLKKNDPQAWEDFINSAFETQWAAAVSSREGSV